MKIEASDPPREFVVGRARDITIRDAGRVRLEPDEQVTFLTGDNREYDVARKSWGFYATPSLNGRLRDQGLRPALVRNAAGRYYLLLVESRALAAFESYLAAEALDVVVWLDDDRQLDRLAAAFDEDEA